MRAALLIVSILFVAGLAFANSAQRDCGCCCTNEFGTPRATPTETATETPTPELPASTPGNEVVCPFLTAGTYENVGVSGTAFDLVSFGAANPTIVLAYNNAVGTSKRIWTHNFGAAIPADATILGIGIFDGSSALPNGVVPPFIPTNPPCNSWASEPVNTFAKLTKAGVLVGNDKTTGHNITTTPSELFGDSASDLWGTTWTPAQINDSGFGIQLSVGWQTAPTPNKRDCDVYHITVGGDPTLNPRLNAAANFISVCYEHPAPTPTDTPGEAAPTPTRTPGSGDSGCGTYTFSPSDCSTTFTQSTAGGTNIWALTFGSYTAPIVNNSAGLTKQLELHAPCYLADSGWEIPNNAAAAVTGITLHVGVTTAPGCVPPDYHVWDVFPNDTLIKLINASATVVGTNQATTSNWNGGTRDYGANNDTWGVAFTGVTVHDPDFGFAVQLAYDDNLATNDDCGDADSPFVSVQGGGSTTMDICWAIP